MDVKVPLAVALLGGTVQVPTLDSKKTINIEEGTQNNAKVVIKGEGMPRFGSSTTGDETANIIVDIPKHLTKEAERTRQEILRNG